MSIDERLRDSMRRATGPVVPSPDAWSSFERRIERRRRRNNAIRTGAGAVVGLAFVGGLAWAGLELHGHHPAKTMPGNTSEQTLVVSAVKVYPSNENGPGVAKVYGSVTNNGPDPTGAEINCTLDDANGQQVATASSSVDYVGPNASQTFGAGAQYETVPTTGTCDAQPRAAVSPSPPPAVQPQFQLGGTAFFDTDHGIAVGSFGTPGCSDGCTGLIQTTADGGTTWTSATKTRYPVVSVTLSGGSDAWAVENDTCAYICPALLHSGDGGKTWTNLGEANVVNPSFASSADGFAFGYQRDAMRAPLLTTTDGGRSWTPTGSACDSPTAWGTFASFVSPTHGWILCDGQPSAGSQSRTLFETTDGGQTLARVAATGLGTNGYPQAMAFRPDGNGWIGLGNAVVSIMRTTDGGGHWTSPITIDANGGDIRSLWFLDDSTGYAVISVAGSPADRLIETTDGGTHWSIVHIWQAAA
jgi:photosystem II stability/assembly factor-like uncharacterized protein